MKKIKHLGKKARNIATKLAQRFSAVAPKLKGLRDKKVFRALIASLPVLAIIIALTQVVFAVMIYGFKKEDKVTRAVAAVIPYPIAIVNTQTVSYKEYLNEKDYIRHFYSTTKQEDVNLSEIDKQILDQLVENKIINSQAGRYDVKVTEEDIDNALNSIIDQNGGKQNVEKVLNDLYGIDLNTFKRLIRHQLLRDKINSELITHVTARHILVRVDKDAPEDKVNEAKTKIDGYLNEIKNGADFAETAKKNSEDIGSNEQGGELEPFARGEMVEEFSNAAFSMAVGEISSPIRTEFGWHIIKVEAKEGKIDKKFTDWIDEAKNKSVIKKLI
ncbi:MAG: peptidylprolyl isomerase [Patescibacteria group bacterium]|jgi:foldase protein PrsA